MFNKFTGGSALPPQPSLETIIRGFIGGSLGILCLLYLTQWSGTSWIMAPFGATCVLVFSLPSSPLAQPRNVIGGHFIASLIGLLFINIVGNSAISIAIAVGLSIALMQALRIVHPPAGADPIVIILSGIYGYNFLWSPVLIGSIALILVALIINNIGANTRWPLYWFGFSFLSRAKNSSPHESSIDKTDK